MRICQHGCQMTVVPLPDVPCIRVRLVFDKGVQVEGGNRFNFSYSGSAPTGANCVTLATDIAAAWSTYLATMTPGYVALQEVDVLDIATHSGASGSWNGSDAGTRSAPYIPGQCAANVEFDIARRYRGGKPRAFFIAGVESDLANQVSFSSSFVTSMNSQVADFFAAVGALSVGSVGTLQHVNLSYYKGFTNNTNSSGRERAVPTYRPTALHDNVLGYATKTIIGSQRRRRTSTSP